MKRLEGTRDEIFVDIARANTEIYKDDRSSLNPLHCGDPIPQKEGEHESSHF
jgi:hypothetical protein